MKKITLALFLVICFSIVSMSAVADSAQIQEEITRIESKYNVNLELPDNMSIEESLESLAIVDAHLDENPPIIQIVRDSVEITLSSVSAPPSEGNRKPVTVTKSGTASVWAGIPSIGFGNIKTPFTVTYTSSGGVNTISSCSLRDSYYEGASWGTFDFYRNWWEGAHELDIYTECQFQYTISNVTITSPMQQFVAIVNLSGL